MKHLPTLIAALVTLVVLTGLGAAQEERKGPPEQEALDRESSSKQAGPCPPGSIPPPSGMVAWWPLNEGLGVTTVHDRAGGDNHGTPMLGQNTSAIGPNGPAPIANQFVGNSLQFGMGRYVKVPPAHNLDFGTGDFTIDAWVRFPSQGTQTEPIVHKLDANGGYFLYILSDDQGGRRPVLEIGSLKFIGPSITAPVGTWFFVAATRSVPTVPTPSDQLVTLYVSAGDPPISHHRPISSATSTVPLLIGKWSNPHATLTIDEVEIFDRALQPAEITAIFTAGNKGKCRRNNPNPNPN